MKYTIQINCLNDNEAKNYMKRYGEIHKIKDNKYEINVADEDGFNFYLKNNKCVQVLEKGE